MLFMRRHLQRNLINYDSKDITEMPVFEIGKDFSEKHKYVEQHPDWQEEVFEITKMRLFTKDHVYDYDNKDTDAIVESSNYFTIIKKNLKNINCVRFDDVTYMEFELTNPPPEEVIK